MIVHDEFVEYIWRSYGDHHMEIIWISIRSLSAIHYGDRYCMELWRLYGCLMDVMFRAKYVSNKTNKLNLA